MMMYLIKTILIFFFININIGYTKEKSEVLFSINDNLFTSIDLDKRILYLKILSNSSINFTKQEYIDDYISTLLFNEYAQQKNIIVKDEIVDDYYNRIIENLNIDNEKNIDMSIIRNNILFDYQRKIILERFLKNKRNADLKIEESNLNLYNTVVEYFIIDKKYQNLVNEIKNNKKLIDSNILNEILKEKNIENLFFSKKIDNFKNIDQNIIKQITKENSFFYLSEDEYLTLGFVNKNLKENIDLKFTLFQITLEKKDLDIKNINCNNIENFSNKNKIILKKYDKIKISKLNEYLRKNLKFIDDIIKVNDDQNDTYIILCDIDYNLDLIKEMTLNEKIDKEVEVIENNFINIKKIDYNLILYNE